MPKQLSKEFVRQWLIEQGFMGRDGDTIPEMSMEWIEEISGRYIALYEKLLGVSFDKSKGALDLPTIQKVYDEVSNH